MNETKSMERDFPYVGEKEEPFFALTLDIKNKKNLQEALDLYVKPDLLEGDNKYFCEKYEKHVDAQRRTYLKSLSSTFVINLKRFEFNYQTMQRYKINDYCEFPEIIDLRPWTKQGIEERETKGKGGRRVRNRSESNVHVTSQGRVDDEDMKMEEADENESR